MHTFFECFYKEFELRNVSWTISSEFHEISKNTFFMNTTKQLLLKMLLMNWKLFSCENKSL